ncbi:MAG: hypothetical protein VB099_20590 [Candidatus Limiplasma sp.]|nr:hypothetical protein [Candidatus Limiplasma sp.]
MDRRIFAFTVLTDEELEQNGLLFSTNGDVLGRILADHKFQVGDVEQYSYDIESMPETFSRLEKGEVKIYGIDKYHVNKCSIMYTRK